ncbi:MAG: type II secretion system F family protein [Candidatus Hydrogenedentes bacterium]|nr:type II secretion system F family protein [Candidatus Hydrogenedentota bacterium]
MPQYRYEVKKAPGDHSSGVLEAESERAALARLRDMGYFPIAIEEYTGERRGDVIRQALVRVRLKDRNTFFRQLANLYESGMPLTRALSTLVEQTANPKLAAVIDQLRDDVQKGATFAEALRRHPRLFPALCCSMIHAGESGGMLDEVLWRIVAYGEQDEELRGKAVSAMIYPAFLMLMSTIAIFILVSFVFPKFSAVFEDFQASLPWQTKIVMSFCEFMGRFWWAVLIGVALLALGFISYARSEAGRLQLDRAMLRVPVVRNVVQKYVMAQFARTLGTLLDNGVPILTALNITVETLGNKAVASEVAIVQARVAEGDSVSAGLRQCEYFPPMVINMFAVGEESGRIGAVTKRMADAYDVEVDRAVKAATSLLEPILIVAMGVTVGFLVIAMLLPMLTLSATVV